VNSLSEEVTQENEGWHAEPSAAGMPNEKARLLRCGQAHASLS
jgi:hypothetical protein